MDDKIKLRYIADHGFKEIQINDTLILLALSKLQDEWNNRASSDKIEEGLQLIEKYGSLVGTEYNNY